ncbi:type IV secretion system protein [Bradyrhizobium algeriense]|uniref:type IV secretion system protein n=1 Tax=Bradyrhizobium algeriense TaxID=634784 RepID=UPI001FCE80BF|nr:type IV secretion system protein [Bradyrhizobium algeriense]
MGLISNIAHSIDITLVDYVQVVFQTVANPIQALLGAIALIALLFIALNHVVQFRSVNYSIYLQWGLRYVLIYSFATMWENFKGIYVILTQVPSDYSALLVRGVVAKIADSSLYTANIVDTYSAMDESARVVQLIAKDHFSHVSFISMFKVGRAIRDVFFGAFAFTVGGFFIAACIIIVLVGKLGLMVAISLAPLAITMLMMPQTKQYFESWARFTVGYAVIPLLTTALMAVVLNMLLEETRAASSESFVVIFIMIAATILLFQIPTMASTLASASVAAVGAGAAVAAASMAKGVTMSVFAKAQRLQDVATVRAVEAQASPAMAASPAINAMRQGAGMRQRHWDDRVARRAAEQLSP